MNSLRKRVDKGRHRLIVTGGTFPKGHRKISGRNGETCGRMFLGKMDSPTQLRTQTEGQLPEGTL
jgi:hypothetical protein